MSDESERGSPDPHKENNVDVDVHAPIGHFFSQYAETVKRFSNNLPHWQQGEVWCFVTWRLADSLPLEKLRVWQDEKEAWLKLHPEPWDEATVEEYCERFMMRIDDWLDQGSGSCALRDARNAAIVVGALRHFDGERYQLAAFVVMPNHVHVLFHPFSGYDISSIIKSWKGFSAREINKRMGTSGAFWQAEFWDRLVRSEKQFYAYVRYIKDNPGKAELKDGFVAWNVESESERGSHAESERGRPRPHNNVGQETHAPVSDVDKNVHAPIYAPIHIRRKT